MNQVHLQQNQVNRKIMTKDINFLKRVQKPWRYKWKKYSKSKETTKAFERLHVALLRRWPTNKKIFDGSDESEVVLNPTQRQGFD